MSRVTASTIRNRSMASLFAPKNSLLHCPRTAKVSNFVRGKAQRKFESSLTMHRNHRLAVRVGCLLHHQPPLKSPDCRGVDVVASAHIQRQINTAKLLIYA
jgi:hypothetical protein